MSSLLAIKGPSLGVRYELGEVTRIGRSPENEVQIADSNVSRLHAEIVQKRMSYTIFDRDSRNGIVVNGRRVSEQVLLRNDEIVIGNATFLFNSDLNIRNARFSDSSVYLYPVDDETISAARRESMLDGLSGSERDSIDFLMRFAELFAAPAAPLIETARRLIEQVMQLLLADEAALLLRDKVSGEMEPIVALPDGATVYLNRGVLNSVAESRQPMLLCDRPRESVAAGEESREISLVCAPILLESEVLGVLAAGKFERDFYSLRDLGLLHAVAKLAAGMLQAAQAGENKTDGVTSARSPSPFESTSAVIQRIAADAKRAAASDVTVLITGESGTGKELLAREIHRLSPRREGPFIALNCGAIPGALFESELFGYEKGAFTGAAKTTQGKIEAAHGGTLFLDEIGELDLALQPKLLRFLQDRTFFRVGGNRAIDARVRIVAATNADLEEAMRQRKFREDLWYRLNVVHLEMPPLRDRLEDIPVLTQDFITRSAEKLSRKAVAISRTALELLQRHDWPGNIRELENAVERAVLLSSQRELGTRDFSHIEEAIRRRTREAEQQVAPMADIEREHILQALQKFNWNQARAAEALGLHRNTLRNKIAEYGIEIARI